MNQPPTVSMGKYQFQARCRGRKIWIVTFFMNNWDVMKKELMFLKLRDSTLYNKFSSEVGGINRIFEGFFYNVFYIHKYISLPSKLGTVRRMQRPKHP